MLQGPFFICALEKIDFRFFFVVGSPDTAAAGARGLHPVGEYIDGGRKPAESDRDYFEGVDNICGRGNVYGARIYLNTVRAVSEAAGK